MKTILKTIALSTVIAGLAAAGTVGAAQATPYTGKSGPYAPVFQGD
jgi:hypothetical protein